MRPGQEADQDPTEFSDLGIINYAVDTTLPPLATQSSREVLHI